ncbi:hypothetical protein HYH02_000030 [Chlamydomonas schloesseri]|uniref:AMP-dependent synthetase/ligase domain-containing protein n=1 Tax=Chlamydomonas schloesseri TaxID=2026947 RepID=A0A835WN16_9CHLO|nr:hypothetical protein HYH02_000030 [Chlamydomonas schloesseri]|eukprot:KAG2449926.1 hypothetical protein HYH02_000030 [Chlamydomonas schloesseri]
MRCQLSQRSNCAHARPARRATPQRPALLGHRPLSSPLRIAQIDRPADVERHGDPSQPAASAVTTSELERLIATASPVEGDVQTLNDIWRRNAMAHGDMLALRDPHHEGSPEMTFRQLHGAMQDLAAGLAELGLQPKDRVALFSENSSRWLVADGAVMAAGAADVVRGATAPPEELLFIAQHSGAAGLVVQDAAALGRLLAAAEAHERAQEGNPLHDLRFIVVLWGEPPAPAAAAAASPSGNSGSGNVSTGSSSSSNGGLRCPVLSYSQVLGAGAEARASGRWQPAAVSPGDLATLVYTSGTTGHPKGVMLTHANLCYQVRNLTHFLQVRPGDRVLSLLPPWHIYERTCSYFVLSSGGQQVYTNIRRLRDDLVAHPPDHLVCVPLVLDTLHTRVMQKIRAGPPHRAAIATALLAAGAAYVRARRVAQGLSVRHALPPKKDAAAAAEEGPVEQGVSWSPVEVARRWAVRLGAALLTALLAPLQALASLLVYRKIREGLGVRRTVISGGGSLAAHLDDFYEALGLEVLNGWGLSETSPVLACRRAVEGQNIRGSVGVPTPGTQLRVVDPDSLQPLPAGRQGLVLARGPGVMAGYWRDEAASARAFRAGGGWFDTGDLGWVAPEGVPGSRCAGHLVLTGRAKDTLVLSSGKNVEPQPIEDAVAASPLIKFVVLVGQDKRELGALVWPDEDALAAAPEAALGPAALEDRLLAEVTRLNAARPDYHPFDHVAHIAVLRTPLSPDDGTLTRTLKPRRPEIAKRYERELTQLLGRLRG